MKKRSLWILLAISMLAGILYGCGTSSDPTIDFENELTGSTSEATTGATTEATTEATTQATTEATTEPTQAETEPSTEPETTVSLEWKNLRLTNQNDSVYLYNGSVNTAEVTWSSDDESIATFKNGYVTAVGEGTTEVHAEYNGSRASCTIVCAFPGEDANNGSQGEAPSDPRAPLLAPPLYQTVSTSFFADAVFVGDSISEGLANYCQAYGGLGEAKFLTRVSYGLYNELYNDFHVSYNGAPTKIEDAIAACGAKKVFIMLGINDIGGSGPNTSITYWPQYIENIRTKNPDVEIYIQTILPIYTGSESNGVTNANVNTYNSQLPEVASANNCKFLNIHQYMVDSTGGLAKEYTSDKYVHLTYDGIRAWIQALYALSGY